MERYCPIVNGLCDGGRLLRDGQKVECSFMVTVTKYDEKEVDCAIKMIAVSLCKIKTEQERSG